MSGDRPSEAPGKPLRTGAAVLIGGDDHLLNVGNFHTNKNALKLSQRAK